MFIETQPSYNIQKYHCFLKIIGSLSKLFSESEIPYLYYRMEEKVFCMAFETDDVSRSDTSIDTKKNNLGIGLKTFLIQNNKTYQKIAEFNHDRDQYVKLKPDDLIYKISELRNKRIDDTKKNYNLSEIIYHCVLRDIGKFKIYEEQMNKIDIENINKIKMNHGSISFNDKLYDYSFNISKSTLLKRFHATNIIYDFDVQILSDPIKKLNNIFQS